MGYPPVLSGEGASGKSAQGSKYGLGQETDALETRHGRAASLGLGGSDISPTRLSNEPDIIPHAVARWTRPPIDTLAARPHLEARQLWGLE
jgi:hypothetical protein